jgi:CDP-6-deoxy-D-xylo-4-hexulose-3-dehydrase
MPEYPDRQHDLDTLKAEVRRFADRHHGKQPFVPGDTPVPVSGKVFDHEELELLIEAALDGWWTEGRFTQQVAKDLAGFLGTRDVMLCNSGSSANLLALSALTSPLAGERRLAPGDEVIGVAAGFPDHDRAHAPVRRGARADGHRAGHVQRRRAPARGRRHAAPRAIMLAHTLGNPWNVDAVMGVAKKHDLWVIEDCCDALGSTYKGRLVGSFGDLGRCRSTPRTT